jgi:hypothetical protein
MYVPSNDPTVRLITARIAASTRWHPEVDTTESSRALRAARLAERIRQEAEKDPPLSTEQRTQLAILLLRGGEAVA